MIFIIKYFYLEFANLGFTGSSRLLDWQNLAKMAAKQRHGASSADNVKLKQPGHNAGKQKHGKKRENNYSSGQSGSKTQKSDMSKGYIVLVIVMGKFGGEPCCC